MPRVIDKRKKAEAIGHAALQTFREAGYHGTRMADIAKAAGVGKGTLYEYFDDKADVLRFVFDDFFRAFREVALRLLRRGLLAAPRREPGPAAGEAPEEPC